MFAVFYQLRRLQLEGTAPLQVERKATLATKWKNIWVYFSHALTPSGSSTLKVMH